jgi:vitamin B12 transporter
MYRRPLAALGCGLCLYTSPAWAVKLDAVDAYLDEIVVTASRLPQPLGHSIQHTTVIDERTIRQSLAPDLPTLLRQQAGIEITQTGGLGTQSSLFLRGANSNQTLVLLDGMRIDSATTGATAIDQLMLADIERIEIVRGNVSALYGSSAIGGVVQIFTKQGKGTPGGAVKLGLGSYGEKRLAAAYGGAFGATSVHLGLSRLTRDGFSAARPEYVPAPPVLAPEDVDKDGYRNTTLTFNLRHSLRPGHELSALGRLSRGEVEYDGTWTNRSEQDLDALQLTSDNRWTEVWSSRLMLGLSRDRLDSYLDTTARGFVRTRNRQAEWLNTFEAAPGQRLTAGLGVLTQRVGSDMVYTRTEREVRHLALGYVGELGRHDLQLNVRHDDYSDFGGRTTGLLGYGLTLTPSWRLVASTSTAFRAPTFNDLYSSYVIYNPNLRPEKARSREFGLQYGQGDLSVRLTRFDTRIKDLIFYEYDPKKNKSNTKNLEKARSDGWEASLAGRLGGVDVRASLTLQDPRDVSNGTPLLRRAKRFGSLSLSHSAGPWAWMAELKASGERQDIHVTNYSRIRVPSYTVMNLSGRYRLSEDLSFEARIDNLFDRDYSLVHGYNTPGRSAYLQLDWRF